MVVFTVSTFCLLVVSAIASPIGGGGSFSFGSGGGNISTASNSSSTSTSSSFSTSTSFSFFASFSKEAYADMLVELSKQSPELEIEQEIPILIKKFGSDSKGASAEITKILLDKDVALYLAKITVSMSSVPFSQRKPAVCAAKLSESIRSAPVQIQKKIAYLIALIGCRLNGFTTIIQKTFIPKIKLPDFPSQPEIWRTFTVDVYYQLIYQLTQTSGDAEIKAQIQKIITELKMTPVDSVKIIQQYLADVKVSQLLIQFIKQISSLPTGTRRPENLAELLIKATSGVSIEVRRKIIAILITYGSNIEGFFNKVETSINNGDLGGSIILSKLPDIWKTFTVDVYYQLLVKLAETTKDIDIRTEIITVINTIKKDPNYMTITIPQYLQDQQVWQVISSLVKEIQQTGQRGPDFLGDLFTKLTKNVSVEIKKKIIAVIVSYGSKLEGFTQKVESFVNQVGTSGLPDVFKSFTVDIYNQLIIQLVQISTDINVKAEIEAIIIAIRDRPTYLTTTIPQYLLDKEVWQIIVKFSEEVKSAGQRGPEFIGQLLVKLTKNVSVEVRRKIIAVIVSYGYKVQGFQQKLEAILAKIGDIDITTAFKGFTVDIYYQIIQKLISISNEGNIKSEIERIIETLKKNPEFITVTVNQYLEDQRVWQIITLFINEVKQAGQKGPDFFAELLVKLTKEAPVDVKNKVIAIIVSQGTKLQAFVQKIGELIGKISNIDLPEVFKTFTVDIYYKLFVQLIEISKDINIGSEIQTILVNLKNDPNFIDTTIIGYLREPEVWKIILAFSKEIKTTGAQGPDRIAELIVKLTKGASVEIRRKIIAVIVSYGSNVQGFTDRITEYIKKVSIELPEVFKTFTIDVYYQLFVKLTQVSTDIDIKKEFETLLVSIRNPNYITTTITEYLREPQVWQIIINFTNEIKRSGQSSPDYLGELIVRLTKGRSVEVRRKVIAIIVSYGNKIQGFIDRIQIFINQHGNTGAPITGGPVTQSTVTGKPGTELPDLWKSFNIEVYYQLFVQLTQVSTDIDIRSEFEALIVSIRNPNFITSTIVEYLREPQVWQIVVNFTNEVNTSGQRGPDFLGELIAKLTKGVSVEVRRKVIAIIVSYGNKIQGFIDRIQVYINEGRNTGAPVTGITGKPGTELPDLWKSFNIEVYYQLFVQLTQVSMDINIRSEFEALIVSIRNQNYLTTTIAEYIREPQVWQIIINFTNEINTNGKLEPNFLGELIVRFTKGTSIEVRRKVIAIIVAYGNGLQGFIDRIRVYINQNGSTRAPVTGVTGKPGNELPDLWKSFNIEVYYQLFVQLTQVSTDINIRSEFEALIVSIRNQNYLTTTIAEYIREPQVWQIIINFTNEVNTSGNRGPDYLGELIVLFTKGTSIEVRRKVIAIIVAYGNGLQGFIDRIRVYINQNGTTKAPVTGVTGKPGTELPDLWKSFNTEVYYQLFVQLTHSSTDINIRKEFEALIVSIRNPNYLTTTIMKYIREPQIWQIIINFTNEVNTSGKREPNYLGELVVRFTKGTTIEVRRKVIAIIVAYGNNQQGFIDRIREFLKQSGTTGAPVTGITGKPGTALPDLWKSFNIEAYYQLFVQITKVSTDINIKSEFEALIVAIRNQNYLTTTIAKYIREPQVWQIIINFTNEVNTSGNRGPDYLGELIVRFTKGTSIEVRRKVIAIIVAYGNGLQGFIDRIRVYIDQNGSTEAPVTGVTGKPGTELPDLWKNFNIEVYYQLFVQLTRIPTNINIRSEFEALIVSIRNPNYLTTTIVEYVNEPQIWQIIINFTNEVNTSGKRDPNYLGELIVRFTNGTTVEVRRKVIAIIVAYGNNLQGFIDRIREFLKQSTTGAPVTGITGKPGSELPELWKSFNIEVYYQLFIQLTQTSTDINIKNEFEALIVSIGNPNYLTTTIVEYIREPQIWQIIINFTNEVNTNGKLEPNYLGELLVRFTKGTTIEVRRKIFAIIISYGNRLQGFIDRIRVFINQSGSTGAPVTGITRKPGSELPELWKTFNIDIYYQLFVQLTQVSTDINIKNEFETLIVSIRNPNYLTTTIVEYIREPQIWQIIINFTNEVNTNGKLEPNYLGELLVRFTKGTTIEVRRKIFAIIIAYGNRLQGFIDRIRVFINQSGSTRAPVTGVTGKPGNELPELWKTFKIDIYYQLFVQLTEVSTDINIRNEFEALIVSIRNQNFITTTIAEYISEPQVWQIIINFTNEVGTSKNREPNYLGELLVKFTKGTTVEVRRKVIAIIVAYGNGFQGFIDRIREFLNRTGTTKAPVSGTPGTELPELWKSFNIEVYYQLFVQLTQLSTDINIRSEFEALIVSIRNPNYLTTTIVDYIQEPQIWQIIINFTNEVKTSGERKPNYLGELLVRFTKGTTIEVRRKVFAIIVAYGNTYQGFIDRITEFLKQFGTTKAPVTEKPRGELPDLWKNFNIEVYFQFFAQFAQVSTDIIIKEEFESIVVSTRNPNYITTTIAGYLREPHVWQIIINFTNEVNKGGISGEYNLGEVFVRATKGTTIEVRRKVLAVIVAYGSRISGFIERIRTFFGNVSIPWNQSTFTSYFSKFSKSTFFEIISQFSINFSINFEVEVPRLVNMYEKEKEKTTSFTATTLVYGDVAKGLVTFFSKINIKEAKPAAFYAETLVGSFRGLNVAAQKKIAEVVFIQGCGKNGFVSEMQQFYKNCTKCKH